MDLNKAIQYLQKNGRQIGDEAQKGNPNAKNIINLYRLVRVNVNDPGAAGLLISAVEEHYKANNS